MTRTGAHRDHYARVHPITDPRPSRFANDGQDYAEWAARADAWRLPDIEDYVHGIVNLHPPMIQCDGCGYVVTGDTLALTVITSGIVFNPRTDVTDQRRMCADCWRDAGWVDDNLRGFTRVETTEVAR